MLVVLDLSHNLIEKLSKFVGVEKLQHLNLSSNKLNEIENGAFSMLVDLEVLDLSGNRLTVLDANVFNNALQLLYIGHNRLTELTDFTSFSIPNGVIMGIDTNRINCSHFKHIFDTIPLKHFHSFTTRIDCNSHSENIEPTPTYQSETTTRTTATAKSKIAVASDEKTPDKNPEIFVPSLNERDRAHKTANQTISDQKSEDKHHNSHLIATIWALAVCLILMLIIAAVCWFRQQQAIQRSSDEAWVMFHTMRLLSHQEK